MAQQQLDDLSKYRHVKVVSEADVDARTKEGWKLIAITQEQAPMSVMRSALLQPPPAGSPAAVRYDNHQAITYVACDQEIGSTTRYVLGLLESDTYAQRVEELESCRQAYREITDTLNNKVKEHAELSQRYEEVMRELTLQRTRTEAAAKEIRRVQQIADRVTKALDSMRAALGDARYFEILSPV